jgi:hypothetical protein
MAGSTAWFDGYHFLGTTDTFVCFSALANRRQRCSRALTCIPSAKQVLDASHPLLKEPPGLVVLSWQPFEIPMLTGSLHVDSLIFRATIADASILGFTLDERSLVEAEVAFSPPLCSCARA